MRTSTLHRACLLSALILLLPFALLAGGTNSTPICAPGLRPGEQLTPGHALESDNREFRLELRQDGRLLLEYINDARVVRTVQLAHDVAFCSLNDKGGFVATMRQGNRTAAIVGNQGFSPDPEKHCLAVLPDGALALLNVPRKCAMWRVERFHIRHLDVWGEGRIDLGPDTISGFTRSINLNTRGKRPVSGTKEQQAQVVPHLLPVSGYEVGFEEQVPRNSVEIQTLMNSPIHEFIATAMLQSACRYRTNPRNLSIVSFPCVIVFYGFGPNSTDIATFEQSRNSFNRYVNDPLDRFVRTNCYTFEGEFAEIRAGDDKPIVYTTERFRNTPLYIGDTGVKMGVKEEPHDEL